MTKRLIIPPPTLNKYDHGRVEECQKAIEDSLLELLGAASDAGWRQSEVVAAIIGGATRNWHRISSLDFSVGLYLKKFMKKRD